MSNRSSKLFISDSNWGRQWLGEYQTTIGQLPQSVSALASLHSYNSNEQIYFRNLDKYNLQFWQIQSGIRQVQYMYNSHRPTNKLKFLNGHIYSIFSSTLSLKTVKSNFELVCVGCSNKLPISLDVCKNASSLSHLHHSRAQIYFWNLDKYN